MEQILQEILTKLTSLENGLEALEKRQAALEKRQENLENGQAALKGDVLGIIRRQDEHYQLLRISE